MVERLDRPVPGPEQVRGATTDRPHYGRWSEPPSARVEVDLDADRDEWAVVTLVGRFDGEQGVVHLEPAVVPADDTFG